MISILFAARNSIYKTIPGLDVWDEDRDALNWPGGNPGIFHPPCRLWSKWMRHFSKAPPEEKELALWSVRQVRKWGGVLEHPACSELWPGAGLPFPGKGRDIYGGMSISLRQQWFGHKAEKATWLYICGANRLPDIPFRLGQPECHYSAVRTVKHPDMQRLSHRERHGTPPAFAHWLIAVAERCSIGRLAA
jgi:hypothetical protein